ncbi:MAG: hypothetical protein IPK11_17915 [Ignavibacteria bacterium]|nr:hypothetical protein [Ignavibacteria bacterium]
MKISNFYDDDDMPSMEARQRMWNRISQSLSTKKQAHFLLKHVAFFMAWWLLC